MRPGRRFSLGVLLALGLAAPHLSAEERSAARLLDEALARYSAAEFAEAVRLLERARSSSPPLRLAARIELHLGINKAVLGNERAALEHFRIALTADPAVRVEGTEIKASIARLLQAARRELGGELTVISDVKDATVLVDGRRAGRTPLRVKLPVGVHEIEVQGPGGRPHELRRVTMAARRTLELEVRLAGPGARGPSSPGASPSTAGPSSPAPAPAASPSTAGPPPPAPPPTTSPSTTRPTAPPPPRRVWTWVAAGTGLAVLATGLGLGLSARSDNEEYWDPATGPQRGAELVEGIESKALAANILFGVGGALAAASVVLFFVEGRASERPAAANATRINLAGTGVVLEGGF